MSEGIRKFFPLCESSSGAEGQGLPNHLLQDTLTGLLEDLRFLRNAVANTEVKMIGASLLIVYEADWEKAKSGLQSIHAVNMSSSFISHVDGKQPTEVDEEDLESEDEDEDEEEDVPYIVKLIDFAHTKLVPGDGPDAGVLKGLDTVIGLIVGRLSELR